MAPDPVGRKSIKTLTLSLKQLEQNTSGLVITQVRGED